ncbi:MAG: [protein-PII] uridylyltransferase, partial [Phenylobacterium sp.]
MLIPQAISDALKHPFDKDNLLDAQQALYDWLAESFGRVPVVDLIQARALFVDQMLNSLWSHMGLDKDRNVTLIAVGGYGRGELHPRSDIDLLILTNNELPPSTIHKIEGFISMLWDLKLDIGHSVRSIEDTISKSVQDITIATTLIEMRLLAGVKVYFNTLRKRLKETVPWSSQDFFIAKVDEQSQRHQKYNGVTYTLEPNLKANPGCLRDIQTIAWIGKYHLMFGNGKKLLRHNFLTEEEYQELIESQNLLWTMRFALHLEAPKKGENRLLFDYQPAVANRLGFGNHGKISVERMMKRLFRVLQRVIELNEMLLHHYQMAIIGQKNPPVINIIDENYQTNDQLIETRHDHVFFQRHNLVQLFLHVAENPKIKGIHSSTIRQLRRFRHRSMGDLQDFEACQSLFIKIFKQPKGMINAVMLMHKHGILAAYLPWWRPIVGQMQFDLFHAYTVDEHTIKVLENCSRFFDKSASTEFPLCNDVAIRFAKPEILFLAAMFHDIAKGRGGMHSVLGAIDVEEFSRVHQLSQYDTKLLVWLVKNHLLLSVTAQRKDIYDPQIIKDFVELVRDEGRLDYLYCLTVADVCATNNTLWNSWKASLFQDLYLFSQKALRRGLEKPLDIRAAIKDRRFDAKAQLLELGFNDQQVVQLWSRFPANYFAHYSSEQICWQTASILNHHELDKPLIQVREVPLRGGTPIFIYYPLQPDMFIKVVSALDDKRLHILDAQLMRSKDGYATNTFIVLEKNGQPIATKSRAATIEKTLLRVLQAEGKKRYPPQRISRKIKQFTIKPKVDFLPSASKVNTLVEITALDTPGLLVQIGQIFKECKLSIHSAKITTIGEKAEDMFVLSNSDNAALTEAQKAQLTEVLHLKLTHK